MCSPGSSAGERHAAGEHAWVENVDGECSSQNEFRVTVNVPFKLSSMADASLDISPALLRLQGPSGADEEVRVPMPIGFRLDAEKAEARYSKKRNQLTITSPYLAVSEHVSGEVASRGNGASPMPVAASPCEVAIESSGTSAAVASTPPAAQESVPGDEEDDDDDLPPPLDAARSVQPSHAKTPASSTVASTAASWDASDSVESNEAAEALMQKALAAREQKRLETEESRRKADLGGSGGLKKGFFSAKTKSSKTNGTAGKATSQNPPAAEAESITYVGAPAKKELEAARKQSLQLPEVQQALKMKQSMQDDKSWMTPQLLQAIQSRPDLAKGLSNPKIQEALGEMGTDPAAAQKKYANDPEVNAFIKEWSGLMATHFDILGKDQDSKTSASASPAPVSAPRPPTGGYNSSNGNASSSEMLVLEDPEVQAAFADPEVQQLLAELRAGRHLEMHELARTNPRLTHRIRILLDKGLLSMAH
jgi:hypothetical protein